MRRTMLAAAALIGLAGPTHAQSMNIPQIVTDTLEQVCGPWMQTGDRAQAIRAAEALGYIASDLYSGAPVDAADPPPWILADGAARHLGRIVMIESRDRVCAVDMAEAGAGQISGIAAGILTDWGMERVLDRGEGAVQVVVWVGQDRQAVMAPSILSSGSSLTLTWLRPAPAEQ